MKTRSTIYKNMKELFKLASSCQDHQRSQEYYCAASALQWVIQNTSWNIKGLWSDYISIDKKDITLSRKR